MTGLDSKATSRDENRLRTLERGSSLVWRARERDQDAQLCLDERIRLAEERIAQLEDDVKDAHDRAQNVEDAIDVVERTLRRLEERLDHDENLDPLDERELGEAGA